MAPAGWERMQPHGLAKAIFTVAVVFSVLSTLVLALRVYSRTKARLFAIEDTLMCVGWLINMVHNSVIAYGTFTGIGSMDAEIPTISTYHEGLKMLFLWQTFFLSGTTLYVLLWVNLISSIFVTIYVLAQCRPIASSWKEVDGTCSSLTITVTITFIISAINLITDSVTAGLPFVMLRQVQIKPRDKIPVIAVLSLGILASVATVARLPFGTAYFKTTDYLHDIGQIILWTVVECDLALIAGSLPMLWTLFRAPEKGIAGEFQGKQGNSSKILHSTELISMRRKIYPIKLSDVDDISEGSTNFPCQSEWPLQR